MPKKTGEIGRIGQYRYGGIDGGHIFFEEFLPELRGNKGVQVYTEMADNDSTIGAILFAIENLIRQCELHVEPAGDTEKDKEAAEFVESCMNDMERTWADTMSEILSFLVYGWSYHEIVYKRRMGKSKDPITNSKYDDGLIGWRKLPLRSQDTFDGWYYKEDSDDLLGMYQAPPPGFHRYMIPMDKALHFRTRSRKDNPEGRSILRTAYRDYYFKKRIQEIEGYGIERDLAGFPVIYSPADVNVWDLEDPEMAQYLAMAENMVSSIRRDAREGAVLPGGENGWKLELLTSGSRRQFDTNTIIERYNRQISTSVIADFLMLGQNQVGSFALADSKTKIFAMSIGTYLDIICEVFNIQAIPRLIDMNGDHFKGITDYPKMAHGDIDEPDLTAYAAFINTMVGAGVLVPDEGIEEQVRRIGNLPEKLETDIPRETQPGENGPQGQETLESKSVYKVTSIIDKYRNGAITREMAAQLFADIGIDQSKVNFYLKEADASKQEKEKADAEKQKAAVQPTGDNVSGQKRKREETPVDDEEDRIQAEEAKKSLGRTITPAGVAKEETDGV